MAFIPARHGRSIHSIDLSYAFNWVSFGPGTREFSSGISIPFLSFSFDSANQIIGRIVFAISTLFMNLVLLLVIYQMVMEFFGKEVDFLEVDKDKEENDTKSESE